MKCTVIIIGTMHLETMKFPNFAEDLRSIIEEINPNIICAELSPEQLETSQTCNSKPEQRDVVIPLAKRLNIKIVPIQPAVKESLKLEKRFNDCVNELKSREPDRSINEYLDYLAIQEAELWESHMRKPDSIERIQLNEFHVFSEARDNLLNKYLPKLYRLYNEWNEGYFRNIDEAICNNQSCLIMVIVGLWHKYWLWNRLMSRTDLNLHNLQSYRMRDKQC